MLPSHSCRGTLQNLHLKLLYSSTQTSADGLNGQRHHVISMTGEKGETWSSFGISKVRSRPESLVSDCSTPALQPPKLRWKMATGGRAGSHRCKLGRGSSSTTRSAGTTHMQSVPPQTYSLSSLLRINITSSSYILTLTHFVRPSPNSPEKLLQYKIYLPFAH